MSDSDVISLAQAAKLMGITRDTAYRLVRAGEFPLPTVKLGRGVKVSRTAVDRWVAQLQGEVVA